MEPAGDVAGEGSVHSSQRSHHQPSDTSNFGQPETKFSTDWASFGGRCIGDRMHVRVFRVHRVCCLRVCEPCAYLSPVCLMCRRRCRFSACARQQQQSAAYNLGGRGVQGFRLVCRARGTAACGSLCAGCDACSRICRSFGLSQHAAYF